MNDFNDIRPARPVERGFTLAEMAAVLLIIGLVVGGVLKGWSLYKNARVNGTVAQIGMIDAAVHTFRDIYTELPGDIVSPGNRLPNCDTAPCTMGGNGNERIDRRPNQNHAANHESARFFVHLQAAELMTGLYPLQGINVWGGFFPEAPVGGGFHIASATGAANEFGSTLIGATQPRRGLYLILTRDAGAVPRPAISAGEAVIIDRKRDDGNPGTGNVRGLGGTNCGTATAYNRDRSGHDCGLFIYIRG